MEKQRKITIDLDKWTSQAQLAKDYGYSIQYVNKLIKNGTLKSKPIEELRVVLVERKNILSSKRLKANELQESSTFN